jgi:hypothetical protein
MMRIHAGVCVCENAIFSGGRRLFIRGIHYPPFLPFYFFISSFVEKWVGVGGMGILLLHLRCDLFYDRIQ